MAAKRGRTVSVVIPARDEEPSVAHVVAGVREQWVERVGLVDEVAVIDSDSRDATAEVARAAGAIVFSAKDIRPDLGPGEGKGEALWKALHVVSGEVLVFLDADLVEWGPHFVSGLLGPLLTDDAVHLVKAVYDRPMLGPSGGEAEAGGRVTGLGARPLLACLLATRPAFLGVTLFACLIGLAVAHGSGLVIDTAKAVLTVFFALVAHAGINVLNDYHDARSGADAANTPRLFSFTPGRPVIP